ncbi:DoxX family protein [Mameliella sp.]|uniref:DoxX family protein n=1 Tax=Mameliella sp. TaxID=1924940 RepID=UPI003B50EE03
MDQLIKSLQNIAPAIGRVLIAVLFISAGYGKIAGYEGTAGYMEMMGVPGGLLPLVILLELGGGLLLLVGYQTRLVAFLLGGFTVIAGVLFHLIPGSGMEGMTAQNEMIHFWKNLAVAGGLGFVFAYGAGVLSVDARVQA